MKPPLKIEDLDRAANVFLTKGVIEGGGWDEFRTRAIDLPEWFDYSLDPFSQLYQQQQDRLWALIAGVTENYSPHKHEQAPEISDMDPLIRPGFYLNTPDIAGDHIIAMGHILKHSAVKPGDHVLEYGAGFGQIALTLARLGALVDTVDVNPNFCNAITRQAEWFNVPLKSFNGTFGFNPRPNERYKLILFYESFHHCREFLELIEILKTIIAADGKILMAGEPVGVGNSPAIPYPWGINLDAEGATVIRIRGWYELVFQENFFLRCFVRSGFVFRKYPGVISNYATMFEFALRPQKISLTNCELIPDDEITWHIGQPSGRFTTANSKLTIDISGKSKAVRVQSINYHPVQLHVKVKLGNYEKDMIFCASETRYFDIPIQDSIDKLEIFSQTIIPKSYGQPDERDLGLFIESLEYID